MTNPLNAIPLPAKLTKPRLIEFLARFDAQRSWKSKRIFGDSAPLSQLRQFIQQLPESGVLDLNAVFTLAKHLYDLELYKYLQQTSLKHKRDEQHNLRKPGDELPKKVRFLRKAIDELFGTARSAGFRTLYYFACHHLVSSNRDCSYQQIQTILSQNEGVNYNRFLKPFFETLCHVPARFAEDVAHLIGREDDDSYSWDSARAHWICSVLPDQFHADYLVFLKEFVFLREEYFPPEQARNKYAREIVYGFFWLLKGNINTPSNRQKIINNAEYLGGLTQINPTPQTFNAKINEIKAMQCLLLAMRNTPAGLMRFGVFAVNPEDPHKGIQERAELKVVEHVMSFL